jgi:hypothetical protein
MIAKRAFFLFLYELQYSLIYGPTVWPWEHLKGHENIKAKMGSKTATVQYTKHQLIDVVVCLFFLA